VSVVLVHRHPLLFQLLAHALCAARQVWGVVPIGGFAERHHDAQLAGLNWPSIRSSIPAYSKRLSLGLVSSITVDSSRNLLKKILHGQPVHP
jgi:hypothetical protein